MAHVRCGACLGEVVRAVKADSRGQVAAERGPELLWGTQCREESASEVGALGLRVAVFIRHGTLRRVAAACFRTRENS